MTLQCPACESIDIEMTNFTGGERFALESYQCGQCNHEFTNRLEA
jgi:transposase-like protein